MSEEQLKAFLEALKADASIQEKLSASTDGEIDTPLEAAAVVAIAKDAGFTITAGDLLREDAQAILELDDDELVKVTGGFLPGRFGSPQFLHAIRYSSI
jgi:predicted ribosomally synthesized peptide with nif11-like leader